MIIDLLGGSYQQKYLAFNSERTINWYSVVSTQQEKSKAKVALFPFPGLTTYVTLPGRYVRALFVARTHAYNRCFAVVDQTLYEILPNRTYNTLGTLQYLGTGSSKVYIICDANDEIGIFHYNVGYVFNMILNSLTRITTNQYPGTVDFATYLDGYSVVCSQGAVFFAINSNMLTGWNALQTFSPTFKTAPVKAVAALKEEIYSFTSETIEVYINDGTTPYSRLPRTTIYNGIVAKDSLVTMNDGFIFLGRGNQGEAAVYSYDSYYSCTPVSNFSINWALNNVASTLEDAYAYVQHTKDGHIFYYLTVPALNQTFVYDLVTKEWIERSSLNPSNDSDGINNYKEFRARHYVNFKSMNLYADKYSGKIFIEDYTNQTEDNNTILRTRISSTLYQEGKNISASMLEIDASTGCGLVSGQGSNPVAMVSYSKDGGYNYFSSRNMKLGTIGDRAYRAKLNKIGTARKWTIKIVVSDPIDLMLQNAFVRGDTSSF